jgi:esterase/lipase superfamily enzyme
MRLSFVLVIALALGACADRTLAPYVSDARSSGAQIRVLTITQREKNEEGDFTGDRTNAPRYLQSTVSIPAKHKTGDVEISYTNPDPKRHFVINAEDTLPDKAAFSSALRSELSKLPRDEREVILFIHGYYQPVQCFMFSTFGHTSRLGLIP